MKKVLLFACVLLSGCSVIDSLKNPRQFDNVEYGSAIQVAQYSTRAIHQCKTMDSPLFTEFVNKLNTKSMFLQEYIDNKDDEEDIAQEAKEVRKLVLEFDSHQPLTQAYCTAKLTNVQNGTRTLARSISHQDLYSPCGASLTELFDPIKELKDKKEITNAEFVELSNDIIRLKRINQGACKSSDRDDLEKAIELIKDVLPFVPL